MFVKAGRVVSNSRTPLHNWRLSDAVDPAERGHIARCVSPETLVLRAAQILGVQAWFALKSHQARSVFAHDFDRIRGDLHRISGVRSANLGRVRATSTRQALGRFRPDPGVVSSKLWTTKDALGRVPHAMAGGMCVVTPRSDDGPIVYSHRAPTRARSWRRESRCGLGFVMRRSAWDLEIRLRGIIQ